MYDRARRDFKGMFCLCYTLNDIGHKPFQALEWLEEVNTLWKNNYFSSDTAHWGDISLVFSTKATHLTSALSRMDGLQYAVRNSFIFCCGII